MKKNISSLLITIVLILFFGCQQKQTYSKEISINDAFFLGTVKVEWLEKPQLYKVSICDKRNGKSDRIYIPFEVFDLQTGDINGDGRTDFCLGLIKPTPHDPTQNKRLFIFQIDRDYIRPLWLGSRLWHRYEKFRVIQSKPGCIVRSIEITGPRTYMMNEYRWRSFGLSWTGSKGNSLSINQAEQLLSE